MNWIVFAIIVILTIIISRIEYKRANKKKGAVIILVGGILISILTGLLFDDQNGKDNLSIDGNYIESDGEANTIVGGDYIIENNYYNTDNITTIPTVLNPSNNYIIAMEHYERLEFIPAEEAMNLAIDELENDSSALPIDVAKYYVALSAIYINLGKYNDSQTALTEAIAWYKIAGADEKDYAFAYTGRGIAYFDLGKDKLAFEDLRMAESILKTKENTAEARSELSNVYMTLGNYYWKYAGDNARSLSYFINAIKLYSEEGQAKTFKKIYTEHNSYLVLQYPSDENGYIISDYFFVKDDLNAAEKERVAYIYANIANPLMEMDFFINATHCLSMAEGLFKDFPITKQYGLSFVYFMLSNVTLTKSMHDHGFMDNESIDLSIKYLEKSLAVFDSLDIKENADVAITYFNLGALCSYSEVYTQKETLYYADRAYQIYKALYGEQAEETIAALENFMAITNA